MTATKSRNFLLPRSFNAVGIILLVLGIIAGLIRFKLGYKPGFLNIRLFTVFSQYIDTKFFTITGNNISEEICGMLILAGLFFMIFARKKYENSLISEIRLKSFQIAVITGFAFLTFCMLFVFGFAFIYMLILNMFVIPVAYLIAFRLLCFKYRKTFREMTEANVQVKPENTNI